MQGTLYPKENNVNYFSLEALIPEEHFLKKVNKVVDLTFITRITEGLYCPNNGRRSIAPELYFRMILLSYLYSIKFTRKLIDEIRYNIVYRWFCGLTIHDKIPHHASLSRIKQRFKKAVFENIFLNIVYQCQQAGLIEGRCVMTDSTFIQANASLDSMKPIDESIPQKSRPSSSCKNTKWQLSNKTHRSVTDPDATLAFKAGMARDLKYKAHVCCDSKRRVITAIHITTGATHDSQPFKELIKELNTRFSNSIKEVVADRAYGSGAILAFLKDYEINSFIPLFTTRSGNNCSEFEGITFDHTRKTYVCSNNVFFHASKVNSDEIITYRTRVKDCRYCPLSDACQAPIVKGRGIRVISRHIHDDIFKQVKRQMETEIFKQKLRERLWKIEGVMNELKNHNGLLRAKYRGIENIQIQAYMASIAINIKRLVFFILLSICFKRSKSAIFYNRPGHHQSHD
ncbi:transposase [Legionella nautarum]|uniref:Transposase n=1 Tax=Legionella nautarum TaxID=45070 RepID=A0A0W0WL17_9GAMM|nr:transposase [Legionella nautarum]